MSPFLWATSSLNNPKVARWGKKPYLVTLALPLLQKFGEIYFLYENKARYYKTFYRCNILVGFTGGW
jgi:hypothetical protein